MGACFSRWWRTHVPCQNPALTMMFFTGLIAATEESIGADEIREITKLLNQLRNAKIKENSANKKKKGKKKTKAKVGVRGL